MGRKLSNKELLRLVKELREDIKRRDNIIEIQQDYISEIMGKDMKLDLELVRTLRKVEEDK